MQTIDLEQHRAPHDLQRMFSRPDRLSEPLYVVTPVINSSRFRTRWKLYEDFAKHVAEAGAILYTVEVAFGARAFAVTEAGNPRHLQLRTHHELWLKEQAINLMVQRLPYDWKYMAWIDADCLFTRGDWADETRHLLQHYPLIQMWSQLHDLNPDHELILQLRSFMDITLNGGAAKVANPYYGQALKAGQKWGSPGLAWACRREFWDQMGGLIDYCILGAGDWHFASAMMGRLDASLSKPLRVPANLVKKMQVYERRAVTGKWQERPLVRNIGLLKGLVLHYWHGPRTGRQYGTRGDILLRNGYDPDLDLKVDSTGLYQLTDRVPELRRDLQRYFAQRNEDAV